MREHIALLGFLGAVGFVGFFPVQASAAASPITYRYEHYLFTLDPAKFPQWHSTQEQWLYNGQVVVPPTELRVDGDQLPGVPAGFERRQVEAYDQGAIRQSLDQEIGTALHRDPGDVAIGTDATGKVTFQGVGLTGRDVDLDRATALTIDALQQGIIEIVLPMIETQPHITVTDPALTAEGIQEVVTIGESDMSRSPPNRKHNIATGLSKFNGTIIPQNTVFSFIDVLGPVNAATGYLRELVIKGDKTVPDYGGGLCQVSSTAYRGVWEYGFPIVSRTNHSYIVSHYFPVGTDATVFTPAPDMKFKNDSPGALLIQTYEEGDNAYFIYYGTRDNRDVQVVGPYIWDRVGPPPDRIEYTTDLAPGERKKVGERVPGMKAVWYRITAHENAADTVERFYSAYQARPLFYQEGIAAEVPVDPGTANLQSGDVPIGQ